MSFPPRLSDGPESRPTPVTSSPVARPWMLSTPVPSSVPRPTPVPLRLGVFHRRPRSFRGGRAWRTPGPPPRGSGAAGPPRGRTSPNTFHVSSPDLSCGGRARPDLPEAEPPRTPSTCQVRTAPEPDHSGPLLRGSGEAGPPPQGRARPDLRTPSEGVGRGRTSPDHCACTAAPVNLQPQTKQTITQHG